MDPNACLSRLIVAIEDNDTKEIYNASQDLRGWINGGGTFPSNLTREAMAMLLYRITTTAN